MDLPRRQARRALSLLAQRQAGRAAPAASSVALLGDLRATADARGWPYRRVAGATIQAREPSRLLAEDAAWLLLNGKRAIREHTQTSLTGDLARGEMYYTHLLSATRYPLPETFVCEVPDALVCSPLGGVLTDRGEAVAQSAVRGVLEPLPPLVDVPAPAERIEGTVLPLLGWGAETNYGHWLIDVLPRLSLLDELPGDLRIGVASPLPAFQAASLELLGIAADRLVPLDAGWHRLERALVCFAAERSTVPHRDHLERLRDRLVAGAFAGSAPARPGRRIFVSRERSRRPLANEAELAPLLERYGFEICRPEELDVGGQVRLFAEASLIVGQNGTGMLNELYCPAGATVIEIMHPVYWHHDICRIAAVLGHRHWSVFAEDAGDGFASRIDPRKLEKVLAYALGEGTVVDEPF